MKDSKEIIQSFLVSNNINLDIDKYIDTLDFNKGKVRQLSGDIVSMVIVDALGGFSEDVKEIANIIFKKKNIHIGRGEKRIIKRSLDYCDMDQLNNISNIDGDIVEIIKKHRKNNEEKVTKSKDTYVKNLKKAIEENNNKRASDYINFLYASIVSNNEYRQRSVYDLFVDNDELIKKHNTEEIYNKIKFNCGKKKKKVKREDATKEFNMIYEKETTKGEEGDADIDAIGIIINQKMYDKFTSKGDFISYCFGLIQKTYNKLKNHRNLVMKVENIFDKDTNNNIKWEIYSYFTIYAENFIKYEENGQFYKPEKICIDFLEHKYGLDNLKEKGKLIEKYYKNEVSLENIKEDIDRRITKNDMEYFNYIHTGFQFTDCIILQGESNENNVGDVKFIKNDNEILLIYSKNQNDRRPIPCPVCGSLKISGNSYTSIGIKSWECKNNTCPGRSKTNRGKRYSKKSNEMQMGASENKKANQIDKGLISYRRRDIVPKANQEKIIEMIIRYYSYAGGRVIFVNFENHNKEKDTIFDRNIKYIEHNTFYSKKTYNNKLYSEFLSSDLIKRFIYNKDQIKEKRDIEINESKLYNMDCLMYLNNVSKDTIDHIVTSPPYYNAREYSSWKNLFNYLNDMYEITKESQYKIKPGGVFLYNIGDIFDNPNTTIKSTMGKKRIALGAYMILVFIVSGYELLDNIIWDKGEPQTNRHKNDGKYTPYYQKSANCYEHMFIFKKPGKIKLNKKPAIESNVVAFGPVIKINSKGENSVGHTAPFPVNLPEISIKTFTDEGDIVYDPFTGSGTTLYVAINNNRIAQGTEMNEEYYNLALHNIREKKLQCTTEHS